MQLLSAGQATLKSALTQKETLSDWISRSF